jgi:hypothetical protein
MSIPCPVRPSELIINAYFSDSQYVRVLYADGVTRYFDYGECYPFRINGALAVWAVWLKSTTCYAYS